MNGYPISRFRCNVRVLGSQVGGLIQLVACIAGLRKIPVGCNQCSICVGQVLQILRGLLEGRIRGNGSIRGYNWGVERERALSAEMAVGIEA